MLASHPVILLISGGWHTPQSYTKLIEALFSSGFEVHAPLLPSMNGCRPPNADLNRDTIFIRSYAEDLFSNGHEIIVLMHSYGGQVGTNALSGFSVASRTKESLRGGVSHLVYMTAIATAEGKSMVDTVRDFGHEQLLPLAFDFADDMSCVHRNPKLLLIGADEGVTGDQADEYIETLRRWNGSCMYQPLTTERAAWRDTPVTYIYTTGDMTVPLDYQKVFVKGMKEAGVQVQCVSLETGHCPNLTRPQKVAQILRQIADGEQVEDEAKARMTTGASTVDLEDAVQNIGTEEA